MNTYGKRYPGSGLIIDSPRHRNSDLELDTSGLHIVEVERAGKRRRRSYASVRFDR